MSKVRLGKLAREAENGEGDGEVKMSAGFLEVGRGEIDGDFFGGEGKIGIDNGAADAVFGFVDGFVGHANDVEGGETTVSIAFDSDDFGGVAVGDGGENMCNHGLRVGLRGIFCKHERDDVRRREDAAR